jgi:hypothetical protein
MIGNYSYRLFLKTKMTKSSGLPNINNAPRALVENNL